MCGIAGIIAPSGCEADLHAAEALVAAMAHRGPDGAGRWRSPDGRVVFAHCRLAIIDLDSRAAQPMVSATGDLAVTFNGEIYNHLELRKELIARGHVFQTVSSDTEVLLEGYRAWGLEGLLARLNGIYSFALHDATADITYLVRDRYGIKPLYICRATREDGKYELVFASELRGITSYPGRRFFVDRGQIARYLTFLSVPAPATMIAGVWKLPAGCGLAVSCGVEATLISFEPHCPATCAPFTPKARPEIVAELRATLGKAVREQLIADVPVGVLLSGGLDSGAVLALASRQCPGLDAYTVAFAEDPDSDETELAALTARFCGARHHVIRLGTAEVLEHMDAVIAALDEPQADWVCVPLWFLAREVATSGTKVVLVGEGADELLVGYEHWRAYLGSIARLGRIARAAAPLSLTVSRLIAAVPAANIRWRARADFLSRAARGKELFWGGAVLCWPTVLKGIWRHVSADIDASVQPHWSGSADRDWPAINDTPARCVDVWYQAIKRAAPSVDYLQRMIALELRQRLPELLLMRVDKMTMAHGVEARVPFLARAMVDFAWSIPSTEKLAGVGTKALLREALQGFLPAAVLEAGKRGFGAPVDRWLRGPFGRRVLREILTGPLSDALAAGVVCNVFRDHVTGRGNHAGLLWALYVLSRWLSIAGLQVLPVQESSCRRPS